MTLNKDGLEAAHAAYESCGQAGHLRSQRLSDGCMSAVITAYISALPAPDDGLVERLLRQLTRTEEGAGTMPAKQAVKLHPDDWNGLCRLVREAATALQSKDEQIEQLTRERDEARGSRDAGRSNFLIMQGTAAAILKRAEAAEQQVRDMREGLEPFAEVGRMLNDEDGWADTDTLQIGADPEFPNFHEISAGAFRRAGRLALKNQESDRG